MRTTLTIEAYVHECLDNMVENGYEPNPDDLHEASEIVDQTDVLDAFDWGEAKTDDVVQLLTPFVASWKAKQRKLS